MDRDRYISKEKDAYGRMIYTYKCDTCGKPTNYARRIKTTAICWDCQKKKYREKQENKQNERNNKIRREFAQMLIEYFPETIIDINGRMYQPHAAINLALERTKQ